MPERAAFVLFPGARTVDWAAVAICVVASAGMVRWKWEVIPVVLAAGLDGLLCETPP